MDWWLPFLLLIQEANLIFTGICKDDQFQCHDGSCIPFERYWDSIEDCSDGSDEIKRGLAEEDCLRRHDIYGLFYPGFNVKRVLSAKSIECASVCRGYLGRGVMCTTVISEKQYCHVPYCGQVTSVDQVLCSFTSSFCGWRIRSDATVKQLDSEDQGIIFHITGQISSKTVFSSPTTFNGYYYSLRYSVNKTSNIVWKLLIDNKRGTRTWNTRNCSECELQIYTIDLKVNVNILIHGYGKYELFFSIFSITQMSSGEFIQRLSSGCSLGEFNCDGQCLSVELLNDGIRDCVGTDDEGLLRIDEFGCNSEEIECQSSRKCIPAHFPTSLKLQCTSNISTFPYELTTSECPSDFFCKQENISSKPICLIQDYICDGIPQCPHWDDESLCSKTSCPAGCVFCSKNEYKCNPNVMSKIPSDAHSIDFSGHSFNLSDFCFLSRIKLVSLNLSRCSLTDITCLIHRFPNLIFLDVSYNNLTNLFLFSNKIHINLDGNPVTSVSWIYQLHYVYSFSLANSGIKTVMVDLQSNYDSGSLLFFRHQVPNFHSYDCSIHYPSYMHYMDLSSNEIESLSFLKNCLSLVYIDLSRNRIQDIPDKSFSPDTAQLMLRNNLLTKITKNALNGLNNLKVLDLRENYIEIITGNAFWQLLSIREIYIQSNRLKYLDGSLFFNLTYLEILNLDENIMEQLPTDVFRDLVSLKTLRIGDNKLKYIQEDLFSHLESLTDLNMKNNKLKYISKGVFSSLVSLRTLDISGNDINVHKDIFYGLPILQTLIVDKFSICCARPKSVSMKNCVGPSVSISSCSYLLKSGFLGPYLWYLAIFILCGCCLFVYRQGTRREYISSWKNQFFIQTSIADILMSLYIFILLLKDVESKGSYGFSHDNWKKGWICEVARFFSSMSLDGTMIFSLIASMGVLIFGRRIQEGKNILIWSLGWMYCIALAVTTIILNKNVFRVLSSSKQICMLIPTISQHDEVDDAGNGYGDWMLVWKIIHTTCSIVILTTQVITVSRRRGREDTLDKLQILIVANVAMRDLILCFTGYLEMVMSMPDAFQELPLFIIPTCSAFSTLLRSCSKPEEETYTVKEIIPQMIPREGLLEKGTYGKMIIILNRRLKSKTNINLPEKDMVVVFSNLSGWRRTIRNIKTIRNFMMCTAPPEDSERNTRDVILEILNTKTNTCIGKFSAVYETPEIATNLV